MSNFTKRKSLNCASNIAFENDSDDDTIIYENGDSCDECGNVSSDELSSDIAKQQTVIRILWMTHAFGVLSIQSNLQQLHHAFLNSFHWAAWM